MKRIKITADKVLQILQGILKEEEIDRKCTDASEGEWYNKRLQEILGIEYYTFKHRPQDSEEIVGRMARENLLPAVDRAFCLFSLLSTERVYAKDSDIVTVGVNLEYWLQTSKVKILEELLDNLAIETNGKRIGLEIEREDRQVVIAVGALQVTELEEATMYGEMAICEIDMDCIFYPNVTSKIDYTVEFAVGSDIENLVWISLPVTSIAISSSMTQKSLPQVNRVENVGNINLSRGRTFSFTFDGYVNAFVEEIVAESLVGDIAGKEEESLNNVDINRSIYMRLTRKDKQYLYVCVIKDHSIQVQEDTGNETHSLTLTARGIA